MFLKKNLVALNYRFSALKNTNSWFKLEPGIGIFFFLAMHAAISPFAEGTICVLKENVGPALRVSLCGSVEVPQPFLQSPEHAGGFITYLNGGLE